MASKQMFALILAMVSAVAPFAMAEDIVVGGKEGWRFDFNYTEWAATQKFWVGNNLVFIYPPGVHNVIPVNGAEFKECNVTHSPRNFTSGRDVVPLKTAGRKWYLCGVADHCSRGQKLAITVLPATTPAPAWPPTAPAWPPTAPAPAAPAPSSSSQIMSNTYKVLMVAAAAAAVLIVWV